MVYMASPLAVWSFNADGTLQHNTFFFHDSTLKLPRQKFLGNLGYNIRILLPLKISAKSFIRQNSYTSIKKTNLVVSAGWSLGDENIGGSIDPPPYTSYIDSNTGEPVPAMGARPSIPDKKFWSEDTAIRMRSAQTSFPSDKSVSTSKPSYGQKPGSRRKKFREHAAVPESSPGETVDDESTVEYSHYSSEEEVEDISTSHVIYEPETDEKTIDTEELAREYGEPHPFVHPSGEKSSQLLNEELWWNWRKPPPGKERWSEWKKRAPDIDSVMAKAMAESGQIKLFGDWPTIAEASLARARKRVLREERMKMEEERKRELGPLAYYQEWVKSWNKDTSKEFVQKHFEETGEDVHEQLATMFQHQTDREYRIMMGTDTRIRRDPLTMRMQPELKKAVFGGDPVYPTINYEQDPDHTVDYRGPNFHEPVPDILEYLEQKGRLSEDDEEFSQQEEKGGEHGELDEAMAGAIDIGEKDDEDEDEVEVEEEEIPDSTSIVAGQSSLDKDEAQDEVEEDEISGSRSAVDDDSSWDEDEDEDEDEVKEDEIPDSRSPGLDHPSWDEDEGEDEDEVEEDEIAD